MANKYQKEQTGYRERMMSALEPKFKEYTNRFLNPMQDASRWTMDRAREMIADPLKRGYDAATKGLMFGRQADALTGARTTAMKNYGNLASAQGMGKTGQAARWMKDYDTDYTANLRGAGRDVELADAEAKRSDLWNAYNLAGQGFGQLGQTAQTGLGAYGAEQGLYTGASDMAARQAQLNLAQQQADQQGFWGSFKSALGSGLGNWFGGGFAKK